MIFFDVAFFAAIAPLLPEYVDDLGMSKAQAGILSASYAAGTLVASLPAGYVASRLGPRRTVIIGLLVLGSSSVVFGFAEQIYLLDSARFVQGVAGALIWSGALTWLITVSARGAARFGDRHRPWHRCGWGAAGPGAGRDCRLGRHRARLQLGHGDHRAAGAGRRSPAGDPHARDAVAARGGGGDAQPPGGRGGDLRCRALGDVRRDRGAGAAADRRPRRRPRRDRRGLYRRGRPGGCVGAGRGSDLRPGRPPHAVRQSGSRSARWRWSASPRWRPWARCSPH